MKDRFDDTAIRTAIRKRLILCRKETGLTQGEIGSIVGKSTHAVGSWEQGYSLPDLETFLKLARFYGKSLEYMFGEED